MRILLGFLSGVIGLLAGWAGLAALVIAIAGPDRDGGIAMGAFFNIGPIGGLIGFIGGLFLFAKCGVVTPGKSVEAENTAAQPASRRAHVSRIYAFAVLALAGGLAWWAWYELIRSPYLSHGYMTLDLQFRLPAGMALPPDATDVRISMEEGQQYASVLLGARWHGTDGDRRVILASTTLSLKTGRRSVALELPGVAEQTWRLDLPSDPDPTPGFSPWRFPIGGPGAQVQMNYKLSSER